MNIVPNLRNCVNGILKTELFQEVQDSYTCIDCSKHTGKKKSVSACSSWSTKFLDHKAILQQSHKRVKGKQMLKTLLFTRSSGGECTEELSRNNTILQYSSSPACLQ